MSLCVKCGEEVGIIKKSWEKPAVLSVAGADLRGGEADVTNSVSGQMGAGRRRSGGIDNLPGMRYLIVRITAFRHAFMQRYRSGYNENDSKSFDG